MVKLFVLESEVELLEGQNITLTSQINDLSELRNHQSGFTNQFRIPKTKNNLKIFEGIDNVQSNCNIPYRKTKIRLWIDGVEQISNGYLIVDSIDTNIIATVYDGNVDFFNAIEGKKLSDLNLSSMDHVWDLITMDSLVNATYVDGYKYPLIDWGNFPFDNRNINPINMRFAVFVRAIVDKIFSEAKYTYSGDILDIPIYDKLLLPCNKNELERSADYIESNYFKVRISNPGFLLGDTSTNNYCWIGCDLNNVSPYEDASSNFIIDATWNVYLGAPTASTNGLSVIVPGDWDIEIEIDVTVTNYNGAAPLKSISVQIEGQPVSVPATQLISLTGNGAFTLKLKQTVKIPFIGMYGGWRNGIMGFIMSAVGCDAQVTAGYISGQPSNKGVYYGSEVSIKKNILDISQKDFIKSIAQMFNLFISCDSSHKSAIIHPFNTIVENIYKAIDWTDKVNMDATKIKHEFKIGRYAQINYLTYKKDEGDLLAFDKFSDGEIKIDSHTLPDEATVINLPYAGTVMVKKLSQLDLPSIIIIDPDTGDATIDTVQRLLIDSTDVVPNRIAYGDIHLNDGTAVATWPIAPFCYFALDSQSDNLSFNDNLMDKYFLSLTRVLNKTKRVTLQLKLSAVEYYYLDHFIPVYLNQFNAYFYVNKVSNWRSGGLCTAELIRLNNEDSTMLNPCRNLFFPGEPYAGSAGWVDDNGLGEWTFPSTGITGNGVGGSPGWLYYKYFPYLIEGKLYKLKIKYNNTGTDKDLSIRFYDSVVGVYVTFPTIAADAQGYIEYEFTGYKQVGLNFIQFGIVDSGDDIIQFNYIHIIPSDCQ